MSSSCKDGGRFAGTRRPIKKKIWKLKMTCDVTEMFPWLDYTTLTSDPAIVFFSTATTSSCCTTSSTEFGRLYVNYKNFILRRNTGNTSQCKVYCFGASLLYIWKMMLYCKDFSESKRYYRDINSVYQYKYTYYFSTQGIRLFSVVVCLDVFWTLKKLSIISRGFSI